MKKNVKKYFIWYGFLFYVLVSLFLITFIIYFNFSKKIYITLNGSNTETININSNYKDAGYTVEYCNSILKINCKEIDSTIINDVDTNNLGEYEVTYTSKYKNKIKTIKRHIIVADIESPVIVLNEDKLTCPNSDYVESGYSAVDNVDGDITDKVSIVTEKDIIIYSVSDSSNNSTSISRKIKYGDDEKPSITLKGNSTIYIPVGGKYNEPGYTVKDNCIENLTDKVTSTNDIDINNAGTYTVTYKVSDGTNEDIVTRSVRVYKKQNTPTIYPQGKIVYLTFDDGPCGNTQRLLDILDRYNVKATFFVINKGNLNYLIKKAYDKGHSIGLHSNTHDYSIYSSVDTFFNDLNKISNIVYNQTGEYSTLMRFPGGSSNTVSRSYKKGIMSTLATEVTIRGYVYFDWNVDSGDINTNSKNAIVNNVINGMKNNQYSVVLQHDMKYNSVEAVADIIEYGLNNGYTFLPLERTSPKAHHGINN